MGLSDGEQRILGLFTAAVLGRFDEVERLRRSAPAGEPDRAWREALLQVHVFAGFPRAVETYDALQACGGAGTPGPDEVLGEGEEPARGRALFERVYRDQAERVGAFLEEAHPDFSRWILGHAYGRVLSRPGLAADRRELLAVCALAALGQDRQLASHVRGARRCGASAEEVRAALDAVGDLIEPQKLERARRVVERYAE